mmetsp:Transcript_8951/g.25164  ORF Transcript_8951/g.25164 Transcript_8951/m.25164 type:complete len:118 (-) Transcript_8951:1450-1803(-)
MVEPTLAHETMEYMMRYCCISTGPPSQEKITGFITMASQAQAQTSAPEQKNTLKLQHSALQVSAIGKFLHDVEKKVYVERAYAKKARFIGANLGATGKGRATIHGWYCPLGMRSTQF